jgi:hypothetical protein
MVSRRVPATAAMSPPSPRPLLRGLPVTHPPSRANLFSVCSRSLAANLLYSFTEANNATLHSTARTPSTFSSSTLLTLNGTKAYVQEEARRTLGSPCVMPCKATLESGRLWEHYTFHTHAFLSSLAATGTTKRIWSQFDGVLKVMSSRRLLLCCPDEAV